MYILLNSRGSNQLYNSSSGISSSIDFSNKNIKSITIYGTSTANTTITLQCSNNNSTWYSTQYQITVQGGGGDFGFAINGFCPKYFRLNSNNNNATLTAYVDYC